MCFFSSFVIFFPREEAIFKKNKIKPLVTQIDKPPIVKDAIVALFIIFPKHIMCLKYDWDRFTEDFFTEKQMSKAGK